MALLDKKVTFFLQRLERNILAVGVLIQIIINSEPVIIFVHEFKKRLILKPLMVNKAQISPKVKHF